MESAGRFSARFRRCGGNNNATQRAARISSSTIAKLLDLPLLSGTVRAAGPAMVDGPRQMPQIARPATLPAYYGLAVDAKAGVDVRRPPPDARPAARLLPKGQIADRHRP